MRGFLLFCFGSGLFIGVFIGKEISTKSSVEYIQTITPCDCDNYNDTLYQPDESDSLEITYGYLRTHGFMNEED